MIANSFNLLLGKGPGIEGNGLLLVETWRSWTAHSSSILQVLS
jgi:hypothetical protein